MVIELGGNICLKGFEQVDRADVLIAKKLVGGYIRRICDELGSCNRALISLEREDDAFVIVVEVDAEKRYSSRSSGSNLFMTIDAALKGALAQMSVSLE